MNKKAEVNRHNPYFNRWFSAIGLTYKEKKTVKSCHNPYFNRWFSAIETPLGMVHHTVKVTILILIDGFLQFILPYPKRSLSRRHNPYFNRWFSAIKLKTYYKVAQKESQSLF